MGRKFRQKCLTGYEVFFKIVPGFGGNFNLWGLVGERDLSQKNSKGEKKNYQVLEGEGREIFWVVFGGR